MPLSDISIKRIASKCTQGSRTNLMMASKQCHRIISDPELWRAIYIKDVSLDAMPLCAFDSLLQKCGCMNIYSSRPWDVASLLHSIGASSSRPLNFLEVLVIHIKSWAIQDIPSNLVSLAMNFKGLRTLCVYLDNYNKQVGNLTISPGLAGMPTLCKLVVNECSFDRLRYLMLTFDDCQCEMKELVEVNIKLSSTDFLCKASHKDIPHLTRVTLKTDQDALDACEVKGQHFRTLEINVHRRKTLSRLARQVHYIDKLVAYVPNAIILTLPPCTFCVINLLSEINGGLVMLCNRANHTLQGCDIFTPSALSLACDGLDKAKINTIVRIHSSTSL